jgi:uncharacterized cupredoxin-like copper-binding protein
MRHLYLIICVGLIAGISLAACDLNDDDDDVVVDNNDVVEMEMGDFYFDPDQLQGSAGDEITIELENVSGQPHTFTIEEGAARGDNFDDWPLSEVDIEVGAGESDSITITLPDEAGEYEFICTIPGHYEAGQWGTLTVN